MFEQANVLCSKFILNLALGKTSQLLSFLTPARRFTNTFGRLWLDFQAVKLCKSMRKDGKKWSNVWHMLWLSILNLRCRDTAAV